MWPRISGTRRHGPDNGLSEYLRALHKIAVELSSPDGKIFILPLLLGAYSNIPPKGNAIPDNLYKDKEIWEKLYAVEAELASQHLEENSWKEGNDGEAIFDNMVLEKARAKDVIDIGCGSGDFTLQVAKIARWVAGIDFSKRAIAVAIASMNRKGARNAEFQRTEAHRLPYSDERFDLAMCRRGPATDDVNNAQEAFRVLTKHGLLMTQETGERDKLNWIQILNKSYSVPENVAAEKVKLLTRVGFNDIEFQEFEPTEYFASMEDVLLRLEDSPIILDFNRDKYQPELKEIEMLFRTPKGIQTNEHRLIITARK